MFYDIVVRNKLTMNIVTRKKISWLNSVMQIVFKLEYIPMLSVSNNAVKFSSLFKLVKNFFFLIESPTPAVSYAFILILSYEQISSIVYFSLHIYHF